MTSLRARLIAATFITAIALPALAAGDDPVVATVNGQNILKSQIEAAHKLLPKQYQQVPFEQIFPALVDSVIDTNLAAADARARKLHEEAEFRDQMRRIEDQILQRTVLQKEMTRNITPEALKKRYDAMVAGLGEKEEVHARHILMKTEKEAKAVIADLEKGGDFAELAKKKSTGPSGPNGGDLGYFGKGQMVPEFETAAFAMEKGTYSKAPVKTQFGFHVIKVENRRKAEAPTFASVAEQLGNEISQERGAAYVENLRKKSKITRFTLDGKPLTDKKVEPKK
ncbi:MAG: peptidylprolyl isomerase [Rhodospirillaceae bacterium]|nr:peptidylprolyl isomerase [Rhodospirillaceae bacterium]